MHTNPRVVIRHVALFAVLCFVVSVIPACKKSTPGGTAGGGQAANSASSDTSGDDEAQTVITIGYSQCNRGEPWRAQMDADIEAACAAHSDRINVILKDAQNEVFEQISHIREFVSSGVDVIIISPKDTSLTQAVADAYDAGIPVIVLDRKVEGDKFTTFIGADNRVIGKAVGDWLVEQLDGSGDVVELRGLMSSTPAIDRSEPFHDVIANTDINVVFSNDMEWLGDKAREMMQAALSAHPDAGSIDAVYGANDPAAIQAWYAAKDAGREDEMIFVGVDALPHEGVKAVREGILDATFLYPNGAEEAIQIALDIAAGKEDIPKTITLGTRLYTPDNVEAGGEPIGSGG